MSSGLSQSAPLTVHYFTLMRQFGVTSIYTGADLGILRGGGCSGPEFFKGGGGGVRIHVRRNFHILTSKKQQHKKQKPSGGGGG